MGFKLKVEGPSTIELGTTIITGVKFRTDIPHDSNARSTDMGSTVTITGKGEHRGDRGIPGCAQVYIPKCFCR